MRAVLTRRGLLGAGAALLAPPADALTIAQIAELSGAAAEAGDAWRSGVELAARQINAAGGIGGRMLEVTTWDTQSSAAGGRLAMQRALEGDPLAVLGPALAESARAALTIARSRGTALIVGSAAADLTGPAHPDTVRALPSAEAMMSRLCRWLREALPAHRIALLWAPREPFSTSRDALLRAARAQGVPLVAEWIAQSANPSADIARLLTALPDALMLLLPAAALPRALAEARRQAKMLALVGEAPLTAPGVLAAAEGAYAHLYRPPDPDPVFAMPYQADNHQPPGPLALAGYLAVATVQAALRKAATPDAGALADALRGLSASAAQEPMLLADCAWNENGDPDRPSYLVQVRAGAPRVLHTLRDAS